MLAIKSVAKPAPAVAAAAEVLGSAPASRRIVLKSSVGPKTEVSRVAKRRIAVGKSPPLMTESVIGPDERVRIFDTDLSPWRMICSLSMTTPNGSFIGSGWLAGPKTIITAGHCVYDKFQMGGWASRIEVVAGRDDQEAPFGRITAKRFSTTDIWEESQNPDFDFGCIHLDEPLGNKTGWFGVLSAPEGDLLNFRVNVAGYPGDLFGGRYLYHHRKSILRATERRIFYDVDSYGGQSGAPAWVQETADGPPLVVGVHAYGTGGTPSNLHIEANSAPRIIPEVAEIIQGWIAGDA